MSNEIDRKVVEMRFDNKNFESNVQTSLSTLDKLKQSLNLESTAKGFSKGFDDMSKSINNISFDDVIDGIQTMSNRFTTLGIVGVRVIENITDGVINLSNKLVSFLTNSVIQGGINRAMNIENAHFMLQGLLKDEEKVKVIMDQAAESVDGTAYSYDSAAKAASQFTASGVESGEQMKKSLRAITGVAAMTNSEYEGISQIFTTVAGNGRLMGDQLLQLSSRGLNAASTLAEFINGVSNGSKTASKEVTKAIKTITSSTQQASEQEIDIQKETLDKQYELQKESSDKLYEQQKKAYDKAYDAKKKALEESYEAMAYSLEKEIEATEKANEKRISDAKESYESDVEAYKKATEEKIALIDKEYSESLKLINEEEYRRIKEIDDQISSIKAQSEAEEKAREKAEREQKLTELQKAVNTATSAKKREKAEQALAEYTAKIAQQELEEQRKKTIADLNNQKQSIKDEICLKKEAAKEKHDLTIKEINEESKQTLESKRKQYEQEISALKESNSEQINLLKDSKKKRLNVLKESHTEELSILRESQTEELTSFKNAQEEKISVLKKSIKEQKKALKSGVSVTEVTESDIRKLVSEGKISFDIFSEAMDDAFGEHAKKANETFTGAMSNVKAALARIGAEFISPLIEQNSPIIEFLNEIRLKINEVKKNIIPFAKSFTTSVKTVASTATKNLHNLDLNDYFTAFYNGVSILKNIFAALSKIIFPIVKAYKSVFPESVIKRIASISENVKQLTEKFKISDSVSKNLTSTFKGVFAIIDILEQAFSALVKNVAPLIFSFGNLAEGILGITGPFGEWLLCLDNTIKKNDIFNKSVEKTIDFVKELKTAIGGFLLKIKERFNIPGLNEMKQSLKEFITVVSSKIKTPGLDLLNSLLSKIQNRITKILQVATTAISTIDEKFSEMNLVKVLSTIWNGIKTVAQEIGSAIGKIISSITSNFGNGDFNEFIDLLNGGTIVGIGMAILKFIDRLLTVVNRAGGMFSNVNKILFNLKNTLLTFQAQIKAEILLKIAKAIAVITASVVVLSLIDSEKLASSLGAVTVLMGDLMASMAAFSKIGTGIGNVFKITTAMTGLSVSILILSFALKKIGSLDIKELVVGIAGVTSLIGLTIASMESMSAKPGFAKSAASMIIFGIALNVMAKALKKIGEMELEDVGKGLLGLTVSLFSISVALKNMPSSASIVDSGVGLISVAVALSIMTKAMKNLGNLSWESIAKGISGTTVALYVMTMMVNQLPKSASLVDSGLGIMAIATAMVIMSKAFQNMGDLSWQSISKGLLGVTVSLFAISVAMKSMPPSASMVDNGIGLIAVSAALVIMSKAMQNLGGMSWEEIAKGIVAIAGSMTVLAVGLRVMTGTQLGSAALLLAATSLLVLVPALKMLGGMSWEEIAKSLVTIAGAFIILGFAGSALLPAIPGIIALSASIALLGAGILGIGAGLMLAGLGLQTLSVGIAALGTSLAVSATAIAAGLTVIILSVVDTIPIIVKKIGESFTELFKAVLSTIIECAPELGEAIKAIVLTTIGVLKECVPTIVDGLLLLLTQILDALIQYTPKIVNDVFVFLIEVLDGITKNLPSLIQAAVRTLMAFFQGIVEAMKEIDTDTLIKGIEGIGLLSAIMVALAAVAAITPAAMGGVLGIGAVLAEFSLVLAEIGAIKQIPGLQWLIDEGGDMLKSVGTAIGKFIGGFVGGALEGITNQLPQIATNLSLFMDNVQPFIEGASKIDADIMNGVKALAEVILLLTAADILNGLTSWLTGGSSLSDFGDELAEFGPKMKEYADSVKGVDAEVINASVNAAKALAGMANNLPKHGGVVQWFTGESSLSDFAKELEDFGPSIKRYSESVKGFEPEAVVASANAAKVLGEMADALPKHDGVVQWFTGESSLSVFAQELEDFGPSIKNYSESVKGFEPEAVISSANAAKVLAEMANTLPKHGGMGGIVDWFAGDNSLSDFAKELEAFGPSMKNYSDSIKDFDAEAVMSSANAAKVLADMKSTLPAQGGIVDWFTGDKSLSVFGEELKKFGPSIKSYADSISGMDTKIVTNSANAGKSLAEMAANIPDTGGLVSWFTGDNDLTTFGSNLVIFGDKFSSYSKFMEAVKPSVVQATTNAADSLVELQKKLNEDNGNWFSGNTTIKDFGNDLSVFGAYFNQYYASISTVKPDHLAKVLKEIDALVDTAKGMNGIDTSGMSEFSAALEVVAQNGINSFISAFENAKERAKKAATDMINNVISAVEDKQKDLNDTFDDTMDAPLTVIKTKLNSFLESGKNVISKLVEGMKLKYSDATNAMLSVLSGMKKKSDDYNGNFNTAGQSLMEGFKTGIASKASSIQNEVTVILNFSVANINLMYFGFYNAGAHLVTGFVLGMKSQTESAKKASQNMASESVKAIRSTLDEHSPSKVGEDLGKNFAMPFVAAVKRHADDSFEAGRDIALSAKSGLSSAIFTIADAVNSNMDYQPTIRPVVDLSDVTRSVESMNSLFNAQKSIELASRTNMGINARIIDAQAGLNINNVDILKEMNNLRGDVSMLSEAISRMKIVMDTGVLVGAIADPMDQELGTRYIYARRGN